jgi:hypothetical protein
VTIVAEGIETEAVMEHLAALGAQTAQGYFISRPLPAEELDEQLSTAFGIVTAPGPQREPGPQCEPGLQREPGPALEPARYAATAPVAASAS